MGKPSKQPSRKSSIQTMNASSKINLSRKTSRSRRQRKQKTEETIKKLFNQLRRDSQTQLSTDSFENSVIEITPLDTSLMTSVIEIDDSIAHNNSSGDVSNIRMPDVSITEISNEPETVKTGNMTDSTSANKIFPTQSKTRTIVIKDDEPGPSVPNKNIYSMHHSTPIKQKPSLDDLILSVGKQLTDDSNNNRTKEINASSFLTIDLTCDSGFNRSTQPTVIDLDATNEQQDCVLTSVSQGSSMSGDSEVTVLRRPTRSRSIASQIKRGLVNLNASEKDRILAFISENLFHGCTTPARIPPRAPETAEDTYIKEVIIGKKLSRNSIGSNIYNPEKYVNTTGLRMVVIDGSNVAMAHGDHKFFSVKGLQIVIDYFLSRGHSVKAFVPRFRNKYGRSSDPQLLMLMERQGHVILTPSREVQGKVITSYDDRYIIQCAAEFEGVIVSNDNYRDLMNENHRWRFVIMNRVLQYNWVNGMIMFPRDPLGKNGPTLEQFLKMPAQNGGAYIPIINFKR